MRLSGWAQLLLQRVPDARAAISPGANPWNVYRGAHARACVRNCHFSRSCPDSCALLGIVPRGSHAPSSDFGANRPGLRVPTRPHAWGRTITVLYHTVRAHLTRICELATRGRPIGLPQLWQGD